MSRTIAITTKTGPTLLRALDAALTFSGNGLGDPMPDYYRNMPGERGQQQRAQWERDDKARKAQHAAELAMQRKIARALLGPMVTKLEQPGGRLTLDELEALAGSATYIGANWRALKTTKRDEHFRAVIYAYLDRVMMTGGKVDLDGEPVPF